MKYEAGVWKSSKAKEVDEFFFQHIDEYMTGEVPVPVWAPDHTDAIWDDKYQITCKLIATKSLETLKRQGIVRTGIKKVDEAAPNRMISPYLSINDIITILDNGHRIYYATRDDLVKIYNACKKYLQFWADRTISNSMEVHTGLEGPVDDLRKIESYMHSIYPLIDHLVENKKQTFAGLMSRFISPYKSPKLLEDTRTKVQAMPDTLGGFE